MLEKGAIAGKMMGSLWFAYSKFRGDWQNLSVCKIWMIQTIFYSPSLCLNTFYIPRVFSSSGGSGLAVAKPHKKNQVSCQQHGGTSQLLFPRPRVTDVLWPLASGAVLAVIQAVIKLLLSCCAPGSLCVVTTGQWSVPVLVTRPIVLGDQAPMGWPVPVSGLTIPSPHGDHWPPPPPGSICHLSPGHWAETKPFKAHVPRITH